MNDNNREAVIVYIPVRRTVGYKGDVSVDYFTRDNTAVAGRHYDEAEGQVEFGPTETLKRIEIVVRPGPHFDSRAFSFSVELGATEGGAELGTYETEVILHPVARRKGSNDDSQSSSDVPSSSSDEDRERDDVFQRSLSKRKRSSSRRFMRRSKKITTIVTTRKKSSLKRSTQS